ncbi:unnamed protein product [Phaeothamnion confervicola]
MMTDDSKKIAEAKKAAGNAAFASKDYKEAIRLYTEAIELDGTNHLYYSNRSACYASMNQQENAAADAEECIRLNPDFVKGYYRLSTAQLELNDFQGALETVQRGLKRDVVVTISPLFIFLTIDNADLQRQLRLVRAKTAASSSSARKGSGTVQVDRQTMEEYQELNEQLVQTGRELAEVQAHLQACQREKRRSVLTRQEIEAVADTCRLHKAVGESCLASRVGQMEGEEEGKGKWRRRRKAGYLHSSGLATFVTCKDADLQTTPLFVHWSFIMFDLCMSALIHSQSDPSGETCS